MFAEPFGRPPGVGALAILFYIEGIKNAVAGLAIGFSGPLILGIPPATLGFLIVVVGVFDWIVAWGLWTLRSWARIIAIALAIVGLVAFPVGTVFSIIVLWYLLKDDTRLAFEEMRYLSQSRVAGVPALHQLHPYLVVTILAVYFGVLAYVVAFLPLLYATLRYGFTVPLAGATVEGCGFLILGSVLFIVAYYAYMKDFKTGRLGPSRRAPVSSRRASDD
jgi:hypothetical protein